MKARIPMSSKQKHVIQERVSQELDKQEKQRVRRMYKLMCVALHELYGFGNGRLYAVIQQISTLSAEHERDEIFWEHVDKVVIKELGIAFEKEEVLQ